jgi:hypothetical protein
MAAHKQAIAIVAILAIATAIAAACGGGSAKNVDSSTAASQQSIDQLTTRVQRDEMLNAWVTISNLPMHDLDAALQGGKIDGKYLPALRTLIRELALTGWSSELQQPMAKFHDDAVALFQGLNAGKDAAALKDLSSAVHKDADAFGSTAGDVVAKDLPADAGGPSRSSAGTATGATPTPHP